MFNFVRVISLYCCLGTCFSHRTWNIVSDQLFVAGMFSTNDVTFCAEANEGLLWSTLWSIHQVQSKLAVPGGERHSDLLTSPGMMVVWWEFHCCLLTRQSATLMNLGWKTKKKPQDLQLVLINGANLSKSEFIKTEHKFVLFLCGSNEADKVSFPLVIRGGSRFFQKYLIPIHAKFKVKNKLISYLCNANLPAQFERNLLGISSFFRIKREAPVFMFGTYNGRIPGWCVTVSLFDAFVAQETFSTR